MPSGGQMPELQQTWPLAHTLPGEHSPHVLPGSLHAPLQQTSDEGQQVAPHAYVSTAQGDGGPQVALAEQTLPPGQ
jgi:hypothetical protein